MSCSFIYYYYFVCVCKVTSPLIACMKYFSSGNETVICENITFPVIGNLVASFLFKPIEIYLGLPNMGNKIKGTYEIK